MTSSMDATEEGKQSVLVLVQLEAAGTCKRKNSGIENLQNNIMNHGDELIHGIMLLFCREGKMRSARRQSQSCGYMQMKKIRVLKLTKQQHESWQRTSCTGTLPQACTFGLVCPCLFPYLIQKLFTNAS